MKMKPLPCANCIHTKICNRKDELEAVGQNILEDYKTHSNGITITIGCDEFYSDHSKFDNLRRDDYFS